MMEWMFLAADANLFCDIDYNYKQIKSLNDAVHWQIAVV